VRRAATCAAEEHFEVHATTTRPKVTATADVHPADLRLQQSQLPW
jgi:hypothetical protein